MQDRNSVTDKKIFEKTCDLSASFPNPVHVTDCIVLNAENEIFIFSDIRQRLQIIAEYLYAL
jgi:hypothetical protein